jgi:hypothetical protein
MIGVIMRPERTPLGKNSERIETSVPEVIRAEMTALAVAADMSLAQYLRNLCITHTRGNALLLRMSQRGASGSWGLDDE